MQVDRDKFQVTQNIDAHPSLQAYHDKIENLFGINWSQTEWKDLRQPLLSGLATRLYLQTIEEPIPEISDIAGQAKYWKQYYNTNPDKSEETFQKKFETIGKKKMQLRWVS